VYSRAPALLVTIVRASVEPNKRRVKLISSFLTALKEDGHSCTVGFTICNLLPRALFHSACQEKKIARRRQVQTSVLRARCESSGSCMAAALAAAPAASLPGRPQCPGIQQNTTDSPEMLRFVTWSRMSARVGRVTDETQRNV
jgi:hypothetical protein